MATIRHSKPAKQDLIDIGAYTIRTWSEAQASAYLTELQDCCHLLALNPRLGRSCDDIRLGLRRMSQGKHVILFRQTPGGILVVRILHQSMLPHRHQVDDAH